MFDHRRLRELLDERIELVAAGGLVERLRAVKEPAEIARIAAAAALADAAFERLVRGGLVGRTERELALALEQEMRRRGAQRPSFPTRSSPPERTGRCRTRSRGTSRSRAGTSS